MQCVCYNQQDGTLRSIILLYSIIVFPSVMLSVKSRVVYLCLADVYKHFGYTELMQVLFSDCLAVPV